MMVLHFVVNVTLIFIALFLQGPGLGPLQHRYASAATRLPFRRYLTISLDTAHSSLAPDGVRCMRLHTHRRPLCEPVIGRFLSRQLCNGFPAHFLGLLHQLPLLLGHITNLRWVSVALC